MKESTNTQHKNILKSLFFFGSIQIVQTIISLVKVKYVSVFIGPAGLGELTIYNTFSNTIVYIIGFGLFNSAVRNISIANAANNLTEVNKIFNLVSKVLLITSLITCSIILILYNKIGELFFDELSDEKSFNFILLLPVILLTVISNRNNMLIQGMGKYKDFGRVALISSGISLFLSFPLFFLYHNKAIIPSLILNALIFYLISSNFKKTLNVKYIFDFNIKNIFSNSNELIKLGIVMMLSSLLGNLVTNLINIYIVKQGSAYELGLYNAALTISLQYVGLVFVSLSSEFYPRLSSVSNNYLEVSNMANKQIEVILVVLFPLLLMMQVFASLITKILFTKEFIVIIPFIQVSTIAIVFQALAYVVSNIPMAMGNKQILFIFNSLLPGIVSLVFSILGFKYWGLMGLVYALYIVNIVHFTTLYFIVKYKFNFKINKDTSRLIFIIILLLTLSLSIVLLTFGITYYLLISLLSILIFYITYRKCLEIFGFNFISVNYWASKFTNKHK